MKEYEVLIREIYEYTVTVEAESEREAIEIASNEYAEQEEYEPNQDNYVDTEFEIVNDIKQDDKSGINHVKSKGIYNPAIGTMQYKHQGQGEICPHIINAAIGTQQSSQRILKT